MVLEERSSSSPAPVATPAASAPSTPAPASAAAKTAAPADKTAATGAASHGSPPVVDPTAPVTFKPNLKFKVLGQEKEFDPFMADVIKDEATEKAVRDLYERAHGIESIKADRKKYQEAYSELAPQHERLTGTFERLQGYIHEGNLAALQRETDITDTMILKRAQDILKQMENPALKQQEDAEFERQQSTFELKGQNQQLLNQVVQARTFELNTVLSRPDVQSVVGAFDAKHGNGAFSREVINRGSMYANIHGVDKSAQELVTEIMGFIGQPSQSQAPAIQQPPVVLSPEGNSEPQGTRVVPPKKPVVPNFAGKGTSPVKKTVTSIEDLKARAKELAAANG